MADDPRPPVVYERSGCPQCGATTVEAAEKACTASQGQDGDYHCSGDVGEIDADGYFTFATIDSLVREIEWFGREMDRMEAEENALLASLGVAPKSAKEKP